MSIDHLKKQSRNLKKLLPDFIKSHPDGVASLSKIQELVARSSGYPSWHAASVANGRTDGVSEVNSDNHESGLVVVNAPLYMAGASLSRAIEETDTTSEVFFRFIDRDLYSRLSSDLMDFVEEINIEEQKNKPHLPDEDHYRNNAPALIEKCKEILGQHPNFIDAVAYLGSSLNLLNRHSETIAFCRPLFAKTCSLLPGGFGGFNGQLNLMHLENREFGRLASILVEALLGIDTPHGDEQAGSIARAMLIWFPKDAFQFDKVLPILQARSKEDSRKKFRGVRATG